jgi:S-DNA-T family DNA segregation ATPase FtsK/SpoIIIE
VSEVEILRVVEHWKNQGRPVYDPSILEAKEAAQETDADGYDEMYDQAVALVSETRQASISMIQRRLRVGYNRAARMIEKMEEEGVVGPADGSKPREVYTRKL